MLAQSAVPSDPPKDPSVGRAGIIIFHFTNEDRETLSFGQLAPGPKAGTLQGCQHESFDNTPTGSCQLCHLNPLFYRCKGCSKDGSQEKLAGHGGAGCGRGRSQTRAISETPDSAGFSRGMLRA